PSWRRSGRASSSRRRAPWRRAASTALRTLRRRRSRSPPARCSRGSAWDGDWTSRTVYCYRRRTMYEKTIQTQNLGKRYGDLWALRNLDLEVGAGTVLGLLGNNGAGKTTTIRLLTTLSTPSEGSGSVAGHDIVTAAARVRSDIGVAAQAATVD